MRRKISIFLVLTIVLALIPTFTFATAPIRVVVDGKLIKFPDSQPFIDGNSRTQVPVRFVTEALGGEVEWDGNTQTVTIKKDKDIITLTIGKKEIKVNNDIKQLDTEALLKEQRTFVPLRFVSEALGAEVSWEPATLTVDIKTKKITDNTGDNSEVVEHHGFSVPKNSPLLFTKTSTDRVQVSFMLNSMFPVFEQQKIDLKNVITSKYGESFGKQVYEHVNQKKERGDELEEKIIYVKSHDQYIYIYGSGSGAPGIQVAIYHPGYKVGGDN